jgi:hypothetical protein
MHPEYLASKWAHEKAELSGATLIEVQHHHAHIASVLGEHALGEPVCGIAFDGTGFGPAFGANADTEKKIMIAYGVYSDTAREDNDYQVILQYDRSVIDKYACPLDQAAPHHEGPASFEARYFFYTGNTTYGIQNLEYDSFSQSWFAAVYPGKKKHFTSFPLFVIDGQKAPVQEVLRGRGNEIGAVLSCASLGELGTDGSIRGVHFPYGATGIASLSDGTFYFSHSAANKEERTFSSTLVKYRFSSEEPSLFKEET